MHFESDKINIITGGIQSGIFDVLDYLWRDTHLSDKSLQCNVFGRNIYDWNVKSLKHRITYLKLFEPKLDIHAGKHSQF